MQWVNASQKAMETFSGTNAAGKIFEWTPKLDADASKLKDKVKNNVAAIGDLYDKGNQRIATMQSKAAEEELKELRAKDATKIKIEQDASDMLGDILTVAFGKNKVAQASELVIEKALAISRVMIATQEAIAASKVWTSALPFGAGIPIQAALVAKDYTSQAWSIASIIASAAAGLVGIGAGKAKGGRITSGYHVNTGTADDTLIVANKSETILTRDHVARLGGSGVMRQIGVPGYAMGGYIGSQTPHIAPAGFNTAELERVFSNRIDRMEVILNVNKVRSASHELDIINTTNKL
jgi:hypothetical protein